MGPSAERQVGPVVMNLGFDPLYALSRRRQGRDVCGDRRKVLFFQIVVILFFGVEKMTREPRIRVLSVKWDLLSCTTMVSTRCNAPLSM